jgi:hypothetical protein
MIAEDLVDKVIESKIAKLVARFEQVHGFASVEEKKATLVAELRQAGEELKEVLKVRTLGQMELLDIIGRGGTVYVETFDPTKHGYGSGSVFTVRDILSQVVNRIPYDTNAKQMNKPKVIIIVDPQV